MKHPNRRDGWTVRLMTALIILLTALPAFAADSSWVQPQHPGDPLNWGRRDGIVFGLDSTGGMKGPRGLIRVGLFANSDKEPQLLNYIAVEPVIQGAGNRFDRMAFSELEMSTLDPGKRGKRMWVDPVAPSGKIETLHVGKETIERLSVRINVEQFTKNGAHVYLVASIDSDQPQELRLATYAESDSPPIEELTLTATMGNYERLRWIWLKDRVISSHELFGKYTGDDFVEAGTYPLNEMVRSEDGDAIVFASSDEQSPHDTEGNQTAHWPYKLPKFTQYWRVRAADVQPDLRVRVNARRVYWASHVPVLGGIAFENFEVRQRFLPGQSFIFGISSKEPWMMDPQMLNFTSLHVPEQQKEAAH